MVVLLFTHTSLVKDRSCLVFVGSGFFPDQFEAEHEPHHTDIKREQGMSILTENIKLYNPFRNRQVLLNHILLLFCILMVCASLLPVKLNGDTENLKKRVEDEADMINNFFHYKGK